MSIPRNSALRILVFAAVLLVIALPSWRRVILASSLSASMLPDATARLRRVTDARALISVLPVELASKVRVGRNEHDLAPYINAALSHGGVFDLGGYTYRIAGRLMPAPGTRFVGTGRFLADPAFNDALRKDGLQMMIRIVDGLNVGKGIVFDGNAIGRPGLWLTGARNTTPVSHVVLDATFRNLSFDGIDISRGAGVWRNRDVAVRGIVDNVGWIGANLEGVEGLVHDGLRVSRTGFHGIYVGYGRDVRGNGFRVDKSVPPYRIYDGPGGFAGKEKGFLFAHFSTRHARWTGFRLFDNRHAGYDGFGIGEDGPLGDAESSDIVARGEIWYAGLFGFDVSSDMAADIKVYFPARQGVQFGLDLGGILSNIKVRASVEGNRQDESARFSATGSAVRNVAIQSGSPVLKVVGGEGFQIVSGQVAVGMGLPQGSKIVSVDGDKVTLDRPAVQTHDAAHPISATFRGTIFFRNCQLELRATKTRYALGIQSEADGFTHYSNVRITGDFSMATSAGVRRLNGPLPKDIEINAKQN